MTLQKFGFVISLLGILGLAACGNTKGDRIASGAGIGAAAGAIGGALLGSPATGAAVGGALGGAAGGLTDQDDIDLGKPLWK